MERSEFYAKLEVFIQQLEKEQNERIARVHPTLDQMARENGRRGYVECGYDEGGKRFVRVWRQSETTPVTGDTGKSVAYFVEKDTGVIFGAKGWKAYNPNHEYGTLDTLDDHAWDDYYGKRKDGKPTMVPKAQRR